MVKVLNAFSQSATSFIPFVCIVTLFIIAVISSLLQRSSGARPGPVLRAFRTRIQWGRAGAPTTAKSVI